MLLLGLDPTSTISPTFPPHLYSHPKVLLPQYQYLHRKYHRIRQLDVKGRPPPNASEDKASVARHREVLLPLILQAL